MTYAEKINRDALILHLQSSLLQTDNPEFEQAIATAIEALKAVKE